MAKSSGREGAQPVHFLQENMEGINHIPTGHLDRNGQMIREGDTVQVTVRPHYIKTDYSKEPTRQAQVTWTDGWTLIYGLQEQEPLNNYGSQELLLKHSN